ncbi:LysR substrate-binding domain-containing protein [Rhodanobacter sp. OK091]|uniref:LysR family transcriptional regulator n=1 Tax=Rhodanobacter sp. OK091 TaxID=1881037 RepID=UPI0009207266|nr:LysR substrate-binding domain-containing protein [Rhodanobacter sp. OK091]SHL58036.1 DNA-binding transcriptional regulator, LysR family [Rhodanobacter sp. OK091]
MSPIDIKHLRYFVGVADELHFGRAAAKLMVTQPALSQQIAALEAILGVQLLIRDRRGVVLTAAGEVFRGQAIEVLAQMETMVEVTRRTAFQNEQRIAIAMVEYTDLPFIVPALTQLQKLYPNLKISRKEMVSTQQIKALIAHQIDIGIGVLLANENQAAKISTRFVIDGRWLLAVPSMHRLAQAKVIHLTDLVDENLIIFSRNVNEPLYDAVLASFQGAKIEPNFVYETTQAQIGLRIVKDSGGLMLGADYVLRERHDGIVYVPIEGLPDLKVHIFWREQESSGLVLDFVEFLAEAALQE